MTEYMKLALHDRSTSLAGLLRNMVAVVDEMEHFYQINDEKLIADINNVKENIIVLEDRIKQLYNDIMYTETNNNEENIYE